MTMLEAMEKKRGDETRPDVPLTYLQIKSGIQHTMACMMYS
jgi:hypothetical protein